MSTRETTSAVSLTLTWTTADAEPLLGLVAGPGDKIVDARLAAPGMEIDGLAARLFEQSWPVRRVGRAGAGSGGAEQDGEEQRGKQAHGEAAHQAKLGPSRPARQSKLW